MGFLTPSERFFDVHFNPRLGNLFRCRRTPIRLRRAACCPASVGQGQSFRNKDFANVTAVTTKDGARATEIAFIGSIRFLRTRTPDVNEFQASPGNQLLQPSFGFLSKFKLSLAVSVLFSAFRRRKPDQTHAYGDAISVGNFYPRWAIDRIGVRVFDRGWRLFARKIAKDVVAHSEDQDNARQRQKRPPSANRPLCPVSATIFHRRDFTNRYRPPGQKIAPLTTFTPLC
jgi:hypothetical protein